MSKLNQEIRVSPHCFTCMNGMQFWTVAVHKVVRNLQQKIKIQNIFQITKIFTGFPSLGTHELR